MLRRGGGPKTKLSAVQGQSAAPIAPTNTHRMPLKAARRSPPTTRGSRPPCPHTRNVDVDPRKRPRDAFPRARLQVGKEGARCRARRRRRCGGAGSGGGGGARGIAPAEVLTG